MKNRSSEYASDLGMSGVRVEQAAQHPQQLRPQFVCRRRSPAVRMRASVARRASSCRQAISVWYARYGVMRGPSG